MMSETKKYKLAYWSIGLALIIWADVAILVYGSEAVFIPTMLLIIIAVPVSLVAQVLGAYLLYYFPDDFLYADIIDTSLYFLFILFAGHLQWFHFIPWFVRKFKGEKII